MNSGGGEPDLKRRAPSNGGVSVLIAQCLQNDYLHGDGRVSGVFVGSAEARRLLSPLLSFMDMARRGGAVVVHLRDAHDLERDSAHLAKFGRHCIVGTEGYAFVQGTYQEGDIVLDAVGLNDVVDTPLLEVLHKLGATPLNARMAVVGCWTDAKVYFNLYDLKTRGFHVATSSALTASASWEAHIEALKRVQVTLDIPVFQGISDCAAWLTSERALLFNEPQPPSLPLISCSSFTLDDEEQALVKHIFPEASQVDLAVMAGGFSGSKVLRATARNLQGQIEFPTLLKLGKRESVLKERIHSLSVEKLLGNNAPRVLGFADSRTKACVQFAFAALLHGGKTAVARNLEDLYHEGDCTDVLEVVCDLLSRLYGTPMYGPTNIFGKDFYDFDGRGWSWGKGGTDVPERIRERINDVLPNQQGENGILIFPGGRKVANVASFMERVVQDFVASHRDDYHFSCVVHGDCNWRNILIDGNRNTFLIDFEYTQIGPALKDLMKLESDLLYVHTKLNNDNDIASALSLSDCLSKVSNLRELPTLSKEEAASHTAPIQKCFRHLSILRKALTETLFARRSGADLWWSKLRYALHALTFDYLRPEQRMWALYDACLASQDLLKRKKLEDERRATSFKVTAFAPGKYVSSLPGRQDWGRTSFEEDLGTLREARISRVVVLITEPETLDWGPHLSIAELEMSFKTSAGVQDFRFECVPPLGAPSLETLLELVSYSTEDKDNDSLLICSFSGLGRASVLAACILLSMGLDATALCGDLESEAQRTAVATFEKECRRK